MEYLMAWARQTWVDDDGSLTVGTLYTAPRMNNIETGIEELFEQVMSEDWKDSCRAATTANIVIATALNNGDTLDGVSLVTGDRVLVKDQTTTKENGIWIVGATPARATDADDAGELSGGTAVYVTSGTRNKQRVFTITTASTITPGTTSHTWAQLEFRDFGLVSSLPTSEAVVGDHCIYKADATNGIFWDLVYDGEGEFPWKKIGGPPLRAEEATPKETSEKTYQTTGAPSITVPLKCEFKARFGARQIQNQGGNVLWEGRAGLFVNAVEKTNTAVTGSGAFDASPADAGTGTLAIAAGQAVQTRYQSIQGTKVTFSVLFVEVDPIRVG